MKLMSPILSQVVMRQYAKQVKTSRIQPVKQGKKQDSKSPPKMKWKPTYKSVLPQYGADSRLALMQGIQRVAKTSSLTLGPGGRNVVLEYEGGDPKITKDGVTIVKSIVEKDRARDMGAKLLKRVANNTNVYAGDGTTTSTLISKELVTRGFKAIEYQGAHPIAIKRGMDKALQVVQGFLKDIAMPITTPEEIKSICMVSSNHNERIAEVVSQVLTSVGIDGVMQIVPSTTGISSFQLVNGLTFDRGFTNPNFIQEESGGNVVEQFIELEHPLVLVVADKIKDVEEILPVLELVKKAKRPLVVFCEDLREDPMSAMVYNSKKGIIQCVAVNMPWTGGVEKDNLKDIAVLTGAVVVDNQHMLATPQVRLEHLGRAQFIKVGEYQTTIVDGQGDQQKLQEYLDEIRVKIRDEEKERLKAVHRERLARLQSKVAEIRVGGHTEVMQGEERDLIVDAINSAKSAMVHGVLPGGGVAMYHASKLLSDGLPDMLDDPSEQVGAKILGEAMKVPINQLIRNKTGVSGANIIDKIEASGDFFTGYDINKQELCDMMDSGIIDSVNVVKVILEDAVSLAGMVVTTECILVKEKNYTPMSFKHYQDRRELF